MTTNKNPWSNISLIFSGLTLISLAGISLLTVLAIKLAEHGLVFPNFLQSITAYRTAWQNSTGNEFTGEATAWLFGISAAPVGLDLIFRTVIRHAPLGESITGFIRQMNKLQRKYLMPLHTYLSVLALGLGILHLYLSSCLSNPLPEIGLIISGVLVFSGLLFKWKAVPSSLRKLLYQFHSHLIVSGVLLTILVTGHAVMSSD